MTHATTVTKIEGPSMKTNTYTIKCTCGWSSFDRSAGDAKFKATDHKKAAKRKGA